MDDVLRVGMTVEQCWHRVPGGTAVAAIGSARALTALPGLRITGVAAAHFRPPAPEWVPPVPVRHLPLPRAVLYESWHRWRRPTVERATGPLDVLHATTMAVPPRSAPLVVTVHDLAFLHDEGHFTRRGVRFFRRGLALVRDEADLILCPSRATLDDCAATGIERDRLRLVPLGIEGAPVSDDDVRSVRARHGLVRDYVMWTGTIEPRKNLSTLIRAFANVDRDVDLVLVGPPGWNEDLDSAVAQSPARDRIRRLGFVARSDLDALYAGARAFAFPSLMEGFGFPVLEAMLHGIPVVTSRATSTEEIAGDAALLVDPRDADALGGAIATLLGDEATAGRLASAGRARAAEYTWERTAELTYEAYRELMTQSVA